MLSDVQKVIYIVTIKCCFIPREVKAALVTKLVNLEYFDDCILAYAIIITKTDTN